MPDKVLDNAQRAKLDENIRKMISFGASKDDVNKYVSDFKTKMGVKQTPVSEPVSTKENKEIEMPKLPSVKEAFGDVLYQRPSSESTLGPSLARKAQIAQEVEEAPKRKKLQEENIAKSKASALESTTKKKLDASGIKYTVGDAIYNKAKSETEKMVNEGTLALTTNSLGEPIYKPSLGFWDSFLESLKMSFNDEKDALEFKRSDINKKIILADSAISKREEMSGVPTGVGGGIGEFLGESSIMLAQAGVGSREGAFLGGEIGSYLGPQAAVAGGVIGGAIGSFSAMAPSSYMKGLKNEAIMRYNQSLQQIKNKKGSLTYQDKVDAMNKALAQGTRAALMDVANVAVLSLLPVGRAAAGKGLMNALNHSVKSAAADVVKFGATSGATQLAKDISANELGYNVKTSDIINNTLNSMGEGAKTALAFWLMHKTTEQIGAVPKYLKSAAKNYLSDIPEPELNNMGKAFENSGVVPEGMTTEVMRKLKKYNAARRKVPPVVPEEHVPSFAGVIEKKDNLQELKQNSDPAFHPKIDEQIAIEDQKLSSMVNSEDPLVHEVDDRTGDSGEPIAQTGKDVEKSLENIEGKEKDVLRTTIEDVVGKRVRYQGKDAVIYKDGQTYVLSIEGTNREIELGNAEKIKDDEISNYKIGYDGEIEIGDDNSVTVRGKKYVNSYSDPKSAINYDENGNIISVTLDTPFGTKRTFRGAVADEIAYQIKLKETAPVEIATVETAPIVEEAKIPEAVSETVREVAPEPTIEPVVEKVDKEEGDDVHIRISGGQSANGVKVTVPSFEGVDFVAVKDGFTYKIYELATGIEVGGTSESTSIEEAVRIASEILLRKGLTKEKFYDNILRLEKHPISPIPILNESEPYKQHKEQRKAEYENLPLLYSPEEIEKLDELRADAEEKGLTNIVEDIDRRKNLRNTGKALKGDVDNIQKSIDFSYRKKQIEEYKSQNEPLPSEYRDKTWTGDAEELKNSVDYFWKKEHYSKLPSDVKRIAENAYKKESEIRNKYGYAPNSLKELDTSINHLLVRYITIKNGKSENREQLLSEQKVKIFEYAKKVEEALRSESESKDKIVYNKYANEFKKGDIIRAEHHVTYEVVDIKKDVTLLKNLSDPYQKGNIVEMSNQYKGFSLETPSVEDVFVAVAKKKSKGQIGIYKDAANVTMPQGNPTGLAMRFFALGGKISRESFVDETTGMVKMGKVDIRQPKEVNESGLVSGSGVSVDRASEIIYSEIPDDVKENIDIRDIRNEIIDILGQYTKRKDVAEDYIKKYGEGFSEEQYMSEMERYYAGKSEEIDAEQKAIDEWIESEGEKEYQLTNDPEYINNLIDEYTRQYQNEAKADSTTETEGVGKADSGFRSTKKVGRLSTGDIPREERLDRDYKEGEREAIEEQLNEIGSIDKAFDEYRKDGFEGSGWTIEEYLIRRACK